jgi:hypothetical protein
LRKVLALFVLFAFLFNSMGYYLLFELDKFLARQEMSAKICDKPFTFKELRIPSAESNRSFHRIDHREFIYQGRLYDFVRETRQAGDLVFLCLHDAREQALVEGLKRAQTHKLHLALLDQLIKIACPEEPMLIGSGGETSLMFSRSVPVIMSVRLPDLSPPPESPRV